MPQLIAILAFLLLGIAGFILVHPSLVICSAFSLGLVYFILIRPVFLVPATNYFNQPGQTHAFNEATCALEALDELDMDYQMGKIDKEDFETASIELKRLYLELKKTSA